MELSELIVIYLACGAPFAVHYATSRRPERAISKFANLILALAAWPAFAIRLMIYQVRHRALAGERRIESIRSEIENSVFPSDNMQSVFEFREAFYRYVGLARSLNENASEEFGNDLYEIVSHPNDILAARCLARKNRSLLERHCSVARTDFYAAIANVARSNSGRERILRLAETLAGQIGDHHVMAKLTDLTPTKISSALDSSSAHALEAAR